MRVRACIGCGYCCRKAMCSVGVAYFGRRVDRCPFLHRDDRGVYLCLLAVNGGDLAHAALGIGTGCCSPMNSTRQELVASGRVRRR